jgi:glycogen(starch) synthase
MTPKPVSATADVRLLWITENYPPDRGGMAQSCDRIVRGLRRLGVEVDVVHFSQRHSGVRIEQQERGRLIRCEVGEDAAHATNLAWNVLGRSTGRFSRVVAFGGFLPLLAAPSFAAWLGAPLTTLLRGNDFDAGIVSPRRGWMLRDALTRSAAVGVVSRDHQHKVASMFPQPLVRWIPNGIDTADWALLEIDRAKAQQWRAQNVAEGRRVVGLFGHLKQKKGGLFFLDAVEASHVAGSLHLLIVGEIEPAMSARLEALSEDVRWTHVPFVDRFELLPWYACCDVVALPSLYDGMPNVLLEAGALGVPVLASTAGGMADVLGTAETALTFPPGDSCGCVRALEAVVELSKSELAQGGLELHARILHEFEARTEAARYHEFLVEPASTSSTSATPRSAASDGVSAGEN